MKSFLLRFVIISNVIGGCTIYAATNNDFKENAIVRQCGHRDGVQHACPILRSWAIHYKYSSTIVTSRSAEEVKILSDVLNSFDSFPEDAMPKRKKVQVESEGFLPKIVELLRKSGLQNSSPDVARNFLTDLCLLESFQTEQDENQEAIESRKFLFSSLKNACNNRPEVGFYLYRTVEKYEREFLHMGISQKVLNSFLALDFEWNSFAVRSAVEL